MTTAICNWANTLRVSSICRTVVRTVPTTHFVRKVLGCTSLCFAFASCKENTEQPKFKADNLTHEQCIKQACLLSVNSASALLTTASVALLDISKVYKDSLNKILVLLEEVKTNGDEDPDLWDAIVEARMHVNRAKASLNELNSYMETVEKVVNSTTEAAFLAGAEYMCTALCERLYLAQKEISKQIFELKKLEEDYLKFQHEIANCKERENKNRLKEKEVFNFVRIDEKDILNS